MDKLTHKIKELNTASTEISIGIKRIKKLFKKDKTIELKLLLLDSMALDLYKYILKTIELEETNKEFRKIIKGI